MRQENERLRDARASVTRQLGPLPISAAIVAGLIAGFSSDGDLKECYLVAAAVAASCMVILSIAYGNMRPYRVLRARKEEARGDEPTETGGKARARADSPTGRALTLLDGPQEEADKISEREWYEAALRLEIDLRGSPRDPKKWLTRRGPWWWKVESLTEGFERERSGLVLVQCLFAVVVVLLILARVA